jgi:predicted nucleic acid-binding protein
VKDLAVRYLVDAGPLVGAFSPRDQWHEWSRATLESIGSEVYTTETVFAEAGHLLKPYPAGLFQLLAALHAGHLRFLNVFPEQALRCAELVRKFAPQMDVGDASLVILSERYPAARLVTIDAGDFNLYRRRDGRPVPALMPPTKLLRG